MVNLSEKDTTKGNYCDVSNFWYIFIVLNFRLVAYLWVGWTYKPILSFFIWDKGQSHVIVT